MSAYLTSLTQGRMHLRWSNPVRWCSIFGGPHNLKGKKKHSYYLYIHSNICQTGVNLSYPWESPASFSHSDSSPSKDSEPNCGCVITVRFVPEWAPSRTNPSGHRPEGCESCGLKWASFPINPVTEVYEGVDWYFHSRSQVALALKIR